MITKEFVKIALDSLEKAGKLENDSKYNESLSWYEEGLSILITLMKLPDCEKVFPDIKNHTKDFLNKAEHLKQVIDQENNLDQLKLTPGQHLQIKIEKDSTGHSYESIFSKFLVQGDVVEVNVEDPYIMDPHQISNFVRFCEMLVKSRSNISSINLLTSRNKSNPQDQMTALEALQNNMRFQHRVSLDVKYSDKLHDREIRFSNGWIVKIGRGLDYFKRMPHENMLGTHDFDFRRCLETTIDIFHKQSICHGT